LFYLPYLFAILNLFLLSSFLGEYKREEEENRFEGSKVKRFTFASIEASFSQKVEEHSPRLSEKEPPRMLSMDPRYLPSGNKLLFATDATHLNFANAHFFAPFATIPQHPPTQYQLRPLFSGLILESHSTPTSPETGKILTLNQTATNAPSPRYLPRAVSRSSDEERQLKTQQLTNSQISQQNTKKNQKINEDYDNDNEVHGSPNISSFVQQQQPSSSTKYRNIVWEYSSDRVGIYDLPARRARIEKYREKRRNLTFRKVRYSARSNICQKRERVGGRFVKTTHVIRADTQALMHPEAVLRSKLKKINDGSELSSVAEMMVGLSKSAAKGFENRSEDRTL